MTHDISTDLRSRVERATSFDDHAHIYVCIVRHPVRVACQLGEMAEHVWGDTYVWYVTINVLLKYQYPMTIDDVTMSVYQTFAA